MAANKISRRHFFGFVISCQISSLIFADSIIRRPKSTNLPTLLSSDEGETYLLVDGWVLRKDDLV